MLTFEDEALVLTALPHGENGAVVRFLSMQGGLRSGFVAGARGKAKRAVLHPGNRVELALKARAEGQLASATVELVESRALLAFEGAGVRQRLGRGAGNAQIRHAWPSAWLANNRWPLH